MRKKAIIGLLCIVMVISCIACFSACSDKKLTVVYIGDSIGEALLGPSPISERERYGYYSILGKINDYNFYNRAISGHQTAQLLEVIKKDDYGAQMTNSLLRTADIIHISIIGNDLLQRNVGEMLVSFLDNNTKTIDDILKLSYQNIDNIIKILKGYNPSAKIIMQTVYNPIYPDSTLINASVRAELRDRGYQPEQFRDLGKLLLGRMNDVIINYVKNNPDDLVLVNVSDAFQKIHEQDAARGERLIYRDWVHPSNEGHAVIADVTQQKLVEMGLANEKSALKQYKKLRIEQLKDLFDDTSVDVKGVKKLISKATTNTEVTKIYFEYTNGVTPKY